MMTSIALDKAIAILLIFVRVVQASCPGDPSCSSHGTCGAWDLCSCHRNWKGFDCSERVCPYGDAWADIKDSTVASREEHHYLECSGKGACNTGSGVCDCFDGFEGASCQRMSCPDDCNGHGTCELMSELNPGYAGWDADKIQVCKCDSGWEGFSCDSRKCKLGDDPLTLHTIGGAAYQVDEVQTLRIWDSAGTDAIAGEFTITYEDWRGAMWTTHAIDIATATAISVEEALEALPNVAIPAVTVAMTGDPAGGTADVSFAITFSSEATPGDQPALIVNNAGCAKHGCQPVYAGLTTAGTLAVSVTETTKGTEERATCSRRGECNTGTGLCECFNGYYGEACQFQTIIT